MASKSYSCPRDDCNFVTEPTEPVLAAAILNLHATSHATSSAGQGNSTKAPPVERPKLQALCPKADWKVFNSRWKSFKAATNISANKLVHQLLGCLDNDLAKLVYNECADPENLDELNLLNLIEKVAVKPENVWVTREKLHSMKQDTGEPITSFAARLKSQARLCGFSKTLICKGAGCGHSNTVDFTDTIVMGDLVRGMADPEVKAIVLGEVVQHTELDELVQHGWRWRQ